MCPVNYMIHALLFAGLILLVGVFPWALTAWGLNWISGLVQRRIRFLGERAFIYMTAPGVAVHELSHAAFCLIFRHKIIKMNLFSPEEDGTLGYVEHQYNPKSLYQRAGNFFVGTGPIWGGVFLLYVLSMLLLPRDVFSSGNSFREGLSFLKFFFSLRPWTSFPFYIWLYAALTISAHITLSPPDVKGAKDGFLIFSCAIFLTCLLLGWCGAWEEYLINKLTHVFIRLFPIIMAIGAALLFFSFVLSFLPLSRKKAD